MATFAQFGACNSDSTCTAAVLGHLGLDSLNALGSQTGCSSNGSETVCGYCCIAEDNLGKPCDS